MSLFHSIYRTKDTDFPMSLFHSIYQTTLRISEAYQSTDYDSHALVNQSTSDLPHSNLIEHTTTTRFVHPSSISIRTALPQYGGDASGINAPYVIQGKFGPEYNVAEIAALLSNHRSATRPESQWTPHKLADIIANEHQELLLLKLWIFYLNNFERANRNAVEGLACEFNQREHVDHSMLTSEQTKYTIPYIDIAPQAKLASVDGNYNRMFQDGIANPISFTKVSARSHRLIQGVAKNKFPEGLLSHGLDSIAYTAYEGSLLPYSNNQVYEYTFKDIVDAIVDYVTANGLSDTSLTMLETAIQITYRPVLTCLSQVTQLGYTQQIAIPPFASGRAVIIQLARDALEIPLGQTMSVTKDFRKTRNYFANFIHVTSRGIQNNKGSIVILQTAMEYIFSKRSELFRCIMECINMPGNASEVSFREALSDIRITDMCGNVPINGRNREQTEFSMFGDDHHSMSVTIHARFEQETERQYGKMYYIPTPTDFTALRHCPDLFPAIRGCDWLRVSQLIRNYRVTYNDLALAKACYAKMVIDGYMSPATKVHIERMHSMYEHHLQLDARGTITYLTTQSIFHPIHRGRGSEPAFAAMNLSDPKAWLRERYNEQTLANIPEGEDDFKIINTLYAVPQYYATISNDEIFVRIIRHESNPDYLRTPESYKYQSLTHPIQFALGAPGTRMGHYPFYLDMDNVCSLYVSMSNGNQYTATASDYSHPFTVTGVSEHRPDPGLLMTLAAYSNSELQLCGTRKSYRIAHKETADKFDVRLSFQGWARGVHDMPGQAPAVGYKSVTINAVNRTISRTTAPKYAKLPPNLVSIAGRVAARRPAPPVNPLPPNVAQSGITLGLPNTDSTHTSVEPNDDKQGHGNNGDVNPGAGASSHGQNQPNNINTTPSSQNKRNSQKKGTKPIDTKSDHQSDTQTPKLVTFN